MSKKKPIHATGTAKVYVNDQYLGTTKEPVQITTHQGSGINEHMPLTPEELVTIGKEPLTIKYHPNPERFNLQAPSLKRLACLEQKIDKLLLLLSLSDVERAFLNTLGDDPSDKTTWQVYADWLAERGHDKDAEYCRKAAER